jgi:hypothetical protein
VALMMSGLLMLLASRGWLTYMVPILLLKPPKPPAPFHPWIDAAVEPVHRHSTKSPTEDLPIGQHEYHEGYGDGGYSYESYSNEGYGMNLPFKTTS